MAERVEQEEIFSQVLRAGRRTYFFDVRATKADDYYLTVTESKNLHMMMEVFVTKNIKFTFTKKTLQIFNKCWVKQLNIF